MVRLQGPENCGGLSHAGESYEADDEGIITVPQHAVGAALAHGFKPLSDDEQPTPDEDEREQPKGPRLHHAGFGRFFVLGDDGLRINDSPLSKDEAMRLLATQRAIARAD